MQWQASAHELAVATGVHELRLITGPGHASDDERRAKNMFHVQAEKLGYDLSAPPQDLPERAPHYSRTASTGWGLAELPHPLSSWWLQIFRSVAQDSGAVQV